MNSSMFHTLISSSVVCLFCIRLGTKVLRLFQVSVGPQIHHNQRLKWTKTKEVEDDQQNNNSKHIELPVDVVELIISSFVKRYSMRYAIRLSVVCKHWLNIVSLETPDEPPWITVTEPFLEYGDIDIDRYISCLNSGWSKVKETFLNYGDRDRYISCLNLWGNEDSMSQAIYRLPDATMAMMTRPASCGRIITLATSKGGWLIFGCYCHYRPKKFSPGVDEHPLNLYNPFLKICFDLVMYSPPKLTCCRQVGEGIIKAFLVLCCDLSPGNYFVVISRICSLSLCRVDGQGKWFYHHNQRHLAYSDLLFQQEEQLLYASDQTGVDIFTVECDNESDIFRLNAISFVQITSNVVDDNKLISRHLVKLCGNVIVVTKASNKDYKPIDPDSGCKVEIHKLGEKGKCLSRIRSIGEHALFLGKAGCGSYCVSARDFPKVQRNCIYYTHYYLDSFTTVSLEDGATNRTCSRDMGLSSYQIYAFGTRFISPPYLNSRQVLSIKC